MLSIDDNVQEKDELLGSGRHSQTPNYLMYFHRLYDTANSISQADWIMIKQVAGELAEIGDEINENFTTCPNHPNSNYIVKKQSEVVNLPNDDMILSSTDYTNSFKGLFWFSLFCVLMRLR
ncbi:hypothetical protein PHET_07166 [Paragonimus heterotremus]|uniref:Uncharacterized protein n=1 Tax=Paragonimus heterotremus TaxID=100268 RepID=A0A8J4T851_9TREM|nr:hypothetical protein PHET_07166 [Paragonimus heterotremus]